MPIHHRLAIAALIAVPACIPAAPEPGEGAPDAAPGPGTDPGASDAGSPDGGPVAAAFDCNAIRGPLSTNRFYEDNPTYTDPVDDTASWTMSTPEAQGLSSARLERAASALAALPQTWSFLVIRHGALVFERYFHGSAKHHANNVHSASKSIWGAAIGIAIGDGLIPSADATLGTTLPASYVAVMSPQTQAVKIRDLLTMTSGTRWTEDTTENQIQQTPDWIASILQLPRAATPGTRFNYSTGNTHIASAVLDTATRMPACEFIHRRLLAPMGIVAERWGRDPQGYFSGGYNFYATPRELAKFGLLYLGDGKWNGAQLVPASWVTASMTNQADAGAPYSYGYTFWLRNLAGHRAAMAWGFAGQMIYIIKDLDLVVVMTTNTRDQGDDTFDGASIVEDEVIPAAT
jgi:CubicO group peptidase (beta-lactamase class C family)